MFSLAQHSLPTPQKSQVPRAGRHHRRWALLLACVWVGSPVTATAAPTAAIARAQILKPLAKARQDALPLAVFCASLATPCTPASTTAYHTAQAGDQRLYLIDTQGPMLIEWDPPPAGRGTRQQWVFSQHQHSVPAVADDGSSDIPLVLYPALYPAGPGRVAVALVSQSREMYSGGGAHFDIADFVLLKTGPDGTGQTERLYSAVPFSCNKMVRACFSEREYRGNPHCHDENTGHLTIQYGNGTDWRFTWTETQWPSGVRQREASTERTPFTQPHDRLGNTSPARLPAAVPFCGGLMS